MKKQIDQQLAKIIDHTLLRADATFDELKKLCEEVVTYGFASVCVGSGNVAEVSRLLGDAKVVIAAVVGFPLGNVAPQAKAFEAAEAIRMGAKEIDMVINLGALKSKNYRAVFEEIDLVVRAALPYPVKVIIEASLLTRDQKVAACVLAQAAQAAFIKTSTGFDRQGGAIVEDLKLIREIVGDRMKIKASGGISSREVAKRMIQAGADRIGSSSGIVLVTEDG